MADDPRITDRAERNAATSFRDNAEGDPDEGVAVTGRPNDIPIRDAEDAPLGGNSTLASRAKAAKKASAKQVSDAEDKSVSSASTKRKK